MTADMPQDRPGIPDLVGSLDIAARLNINPRTVAMWAYRHEDFPKPVLYISKFPAYLWPDVVAWMEARRERWRPEHGGEPMPAPVGEVASR